MSLHSVKRNIFENVVADIRDLNRFEKIHSNFDRVVKIEAFNHDSFVVNVSTLNVFNVLQIVVVFFIQNLRHYHFQISDKKN